MYNHRDGKNQGFAIKIKQTAGRIELNIFIDTQFKYSNYKCIDNTIE